MMLAMRQLSQSRKGGVIFERSTPQLVISGSRSILASLEMKTFDVIFSLRNVPPDIKVYYFTFPFIYLLIIAQFFSIEDLVFESLFL